MRIAVLAVAIVAGILILDEPDEPDVEEGSDKIELPTTCRECDERERTYNTFRCPTCHSEMTPDDHPPLATEWEDDDA